MSSGCGDVLSLADLQTAKKHQIFEAEVITGKAGGIASGANIDFAANPITGQTQKTLPAILRDVGFEPASFDFTTGGTLTVDDRNKVVYDPVSTTWYSWAGALPKVVPSGTNPILDANWKPQTDPKLRQDIADTSDVNKGDALMGIKNPAAWGVARTQHGKNLDTINIKDAGAVCDGVTDDTAVIQSIITQANGGMVKIAFPYGSTVKIAGTLLVPGGVSIDLNHSIINGNGDASTAGTNTVFESAYWDTTDNTLKSNWSVPPESVGIIGLVPDLRITGGRIRFAGTVCKMYQMIYGSSITNLRITACPFPMIIKDSFYGTFEGISVLSPPASVKWPIGWQVESNIQAMGIRKCVAAGFNTGWKITGSSATDCFDTCTAERNARGVDIYGGASGTIMNLELHNWYFEHNTIAVRVDGAAICQRLYLRNCYLHWSILHIDATSVLSGGIDKSCNIQDSATYPGGVNMAGRCGEKTFYIELDDSVSSSHTSSTLPANYSITGVEVKRIETLVNGSNQVIARNLRQTSVAPKNYTGSTLATSLPANTVPFGEVSITSPTSARVVTQVKRSPYNVVMVNLVITDGATTVNAAGTIYGSIHVLQPASAKDFSISYDGSGNLIVTVAGTNITNMSGIVQVL